MEVGPRIFALRPRDRQITDLLGDLRAQACCFSTGRILFFAHPMPHTVLDLLSPDELRQLHRHLESTFFLHHSDTLHYWEGVINQILLRLKFLGYQLPEQLPLQLMYSLARGVYPPRENMAITRWINRGMEDPPPPEVDLEHHVQKPERSFFLPDGSGIALSYREQPVWEAMAEQSDGGQWDPWLACFTEGSPILVDENRVRRSLDSGLGPLWAWYIWVHDGVRYGGGGFVPLEEVIGGRVNANRTQRVGDWYDYPDACFSPYQTDSGNKSWDSEKAHLSDSDSDDSRYKDPSNASEKVKKVNDSSLNSQRREVPRPSVNPTTLYEQLEEHIEPKRKESRNASVKRPKEYPQYNAVNLMHSSSQVSYAQVDRAFEKLQQDCNPAFQNEGNHTFPKRTRGATKGKRFAGFFDSERPYFVRLPHHKVERFPSATTIDPVYIESLKKESGSVYRGEYCRHSTCTLPDHMVGWSQCPGDYLVCPRRFDPKLHKILNPQSINRLTLDAFDHFQVAHKKEDAVLFYDFPTSSWMSMVDMVEMPASLVHFVETLTAFEFQQILKGLIDIDWNESQGWFMSLRKAFIPTQTIPVDQCMIGPTHTPGYDAFGKFPLEYPEEFLGRLTDSFYRAFMKGQVTAARGREGWCLVPVPPNARHKYGFIPLTHELKLKEEVEKIMGFPGAGKKSTLSTKAKGKQRGLEDAQVVTSFDDAYIPYLWREDASHRPALEASTQMPAAYISDESDSKAASPPLPTNGSKKSNKTTPLEKSTTHIGPGYMTGEPSQARPPTRFNKAGPDGRSLGEESWARTPVPPKFAPIQSSDEYWGGKNQGENQSRANKTLREGFPRKQEKQNVHVDDYVDCVECRWPTAKFGSSRTNKNPQPTVTRHSTAKTHPTVARRSTARPKSYSPPRLNARRVESLKHSRPLSASPRNVHRAGERWYSNGGGGEEAFSSLLREFEVDDWCYID
ncbi:hypothetical protein P171DRAFT_441176 [Karstenula rhodostoma CBS 690.94]|uniref:Uncharacterized protein n=1 Tax=Karstenula rhodostoma CBS 690.94 TaxID=1392251 RepID=A0A9P4UEG1_9PLEO|nr:hypothetical protein P171DRAFT_441176 [Karstenula rhodostoma CBS 690.94]